MCRDRNGYTSVYTNFSVHKSPFRSEDPTWKIEVLYNLQSPWSRKELVLDGCTQRAMDSYEVHNRSFIPYLSPLTMPKFAISLANHLTSLKQLDDGSFRDTIDQAQMMLPGEIHIYHSERDICISLGGASTHKRVSIGSYAKRHGLGKSIWTLDS